MCAAKAVKYDYYEARSKVSAKRDGHKRTIYDYVAKGFKMFDTYKTIKDLEKKGKFTENQAASIVEAISGSMEDNVATKQDVELQKQELVALIQLQTEKLRTEMARNHTAIIGWVVGASVATAGVLATTIYYMIKYIPVIQPIVQNLPN